MRYSNRMPMPFLFTACALTTISYTSGHETIPNKNINKQSTTQVKPSKQLETVALKLISQQHNISESDLELEASSVATYRYTGRRVNVFNIGDKRNDNAYQVLLDDTGQAIDEAKLLETEEGARKAAFGKMTEDLYERLKQLSPNEEIGVIIYLDLGPDTDRPKDDTPFDSDKFKKMSPKERQELIHNLEDFDRRLKQYNSARARKVVDPVVQRLKGLGYQPTIMGDSGYLYVKMSTSLIKQIEGWPEVRSISDGDRRVEQPIVKSKQY